MAKVKINFHPKYLGIVLLLLFFYGCKLQPFFKVKTKLNKGFSPGQLWHDNDTIPINAHGGGMLYYNQTYYWFGEYKASGYRGNTSMFGVNCYSSQDLYNWTNEGIVFSNSDNPDSEIAKGCIIERPKVIYNAKTNKFVMWFHLELKGQGYGSARTAVAISDSVVGPYVYIKSFRTNAQTWPFNFIDENKSKKYDFEMKWWTPEWNKTVDEGMFVVRDFETGQMSRDMTLFVDDDGTAYHIHSSEENLTLHISELTDDYLNFTGKWMRVFPGGHNEAPAVFKYNNKYFLISSGCTGWDPNAARSAVSESIWGPWVELGNPCVGENSELTFKSQSTYVINVNGNKKSFIFMGDRWNPNNPVDGRYVWLPVEFENEKPVIRWHNQWDLTFFDSIDNKK